MRTLDQIEAELALPLKQEDVQLRDGQGGKPQEYIGEVEMAHRLNMAVGPLGWEYNVGDVTIQAEIQGSRGNRRSGAPEPVWTILARAIGTLTIRYLIGANEQVFRRTDIGTCAAHNYGSRIEAMEMAQKGAATDAWKRCARYLGPRFGIFLRARFDQDRRDAMTMEAIEALGAPVAAPAAQAEPQNGNDQNKGWAVLKQLLPADLYDKLVKSMTDDPLGDLPIETIVEFDVALKAATNGNSKPLWQSVGVTPKPDIQLAVGTLVCIGEHIHQVSNGDLPKWLRTVSGRVSQASQPVSKASQPVSQASQPVSQASQPVSRVSQAALSAPELETRLIEIVGENAIEVIRALVPLKDDDKNQEIARSINAIARARLGQDGKQDESYKLWADVGVKKGEVPTNGQVKRFALSIPALKKEAIKA